jgi:HEAT repeat protein
METADLLLSGSLSGAGAAALVDMAASGDIGPMLRALSNPRSAESLAAYFAGPGRARLDAVLSSLRRADEPDQMRALGELSQALRQGAAINGYLADLRAIDSGARLMAVEIASLVATPEATAALIEVLGGDPLPEVRIRAANALAGFSDQATEAALTRSRADDPNEAVRRVAELALSRRRDRHPSASAYLSGDAPAPSLPAA